MNITAKNWASKLSSETAATCGAAALIIYALVRGLVNSGTRSFWFDEIGTWSVSQQPNAHAVWSALQHGADGNPPVFYLMERLASHFISNDPIAYRFPSVIAYACLLACLFVFIRKRTGGLIALFCLAATLVTSLVGYAGEARPYSLVLACIAFALVCFQHAPSRLWTLFMALSLILAETFHYYAFLSVFPFAAAEAFFLWRSRKVRWSIWCALAAPTLPIAALWPLLSAQKTLYGAHFWGRPTLFSALQSYSTFLRLSYAEWGIAVFLVLALGVAGAMRRRSSGTQGGKLAAAIPAQEYVLVLAFLALPLIALLVTRLAHGGFAPRYVLSTLLAVPISLAYILLASGRRVTAFASIFVLVLIGFQEMSFWSGRLTGSQKFASPAAPVEKLVSSVDYPNLPVMISGQLEYLPIAHYASPQWNKRFFFVLGDQETIAHRNENTAVIQLRILKSYIPLHESESATLLQDYPEFLLYSHREIGWDWWPVELQKRGYAIHLLARDNVGSVYLVDQGDQTAPSAPPNDGRFLSSSTTTGPTVP